MPEQSEAPVDVKSGIHPFIPFAIAGNSRQRISCLPLWQINMDIQSGTKVT
jgi:hypothetical protein